MNEEDTPQSQNKNNETQPQFPPSEKDGLSQRPPDLTTTSPGTAVRPEGSENDESSASQPHSTDSSQGKPKKKPSKKLPIILTVALLLIIGGLGAWYISRTQQDSAPQQAAQEVREIPLLKIGSTEGPVGNTFPSESSSGVNVSANAQLYEGLVENTGGINEPLLAESWTNPDQSTWVFKLKPGVSFQTGREMTAADVKASIESVSELEFWNSFVSTIESVEATGDLEVTIKTTTPDPLLLNRLSKVYIRDVAAEAGPGLDGTGAYSIDQAANNTETKMRLVAFEDYHQGTPRTKALEFTIYENEESVNQALRNGEIDIHEQSTSVSVGDSEGSSIDRIEYELAGSNGIYLNLLNGDSPLNDSRIREAIAYAIDREALLEQLDDPELIPAYQMVPKTLAGYVNDLATREADLAKAKDLLAEADYNKETELEFIYFDGVQLEPPILIEQLRKAGFTIKATPYATPDEMFAAVENKEFDLFTSTYTSDIADARDVFGSITLDENPIFAGVDNAELDALLAASDEEFDPTERTEALQTVNRYIHDNILWIPIRNSRYSTFYHGGITLDAQDTVDFSTIKYWQVGETVTN